MLHGRRVRSFTDLRATVAERVSIGGDDVEEDISAFLASARPFWKKATWGDALLKDVRLAGEEDEAAHEDPRVVEWVKSLAAQIGVSPREAQMVAHTCSQDYVAQITRDTCGSFGGSPYSTQVVRFYFLERCSKILTKSQLLHFTSQPNSTLGRIRAGLDDERERIVGILAGEVDLSLGPAKVDGGFATDCYRRERSHQRCHEMCLLLQHLFCLAHCGRPRSKAELVSEMKRLLSVQQAGQPAAAAAAAPPAGGADAVEADPGRLSVLSAFLKGKNLLLDAATVNLFKIVFVSYVCQGLTALAPLEAGETVSSLLGSRTYAALTSLDGPEGSLLRLVIYSLENPHSKYNPKISPAMVCSGLAFLLYTLTGKYSPPPETVLSGAAAQQAAARDGAAAHVRGGGAAAQGGDAAGVGGIVANTLIPGVHAVDIFSRCPGAAAGVPADGAGSGDAGTPDAYTDIDRAQECVAEPQRLLARRVLKVMRAFTPSRISDGISEVQLLLMTRVALASRDPESTEGGLPEDADMGEEAAQKGAAGANMIQDLAKTAGWLFPSCVATTALIEIVREAKPSQQDDWWSCLSSLDKVAVQYPFSSTLQGAASVQRDKKEGPSMSVGDQSQCLEEGQRVLAELPYNSTQYELIVLPRDGDGGARVPDALGNWTAPLAPIPNAAQAASAEKSIGDRMELGSLQAEQGPHQVFCVWELPKDKAMNGWHWMCMRMVHIFKIGRRTEPHSERWLVPYLELVNAIVPLFHTMICGPDNNPRDELAHFARAGYLRLQEIEGYLQELQAVLAGCDRHADGGRQIQTFSWTLPVIVGEMISSLIEWQDARCYTQRAGLVNSCSLLLRSLLNMSRIAHSPCPSVTENIVASLRCLFQPGRQTSRSPLLHMFWVVEAANKKCTCTRAILSLLSNLLAHPDDHVHLAEDLYEITSYICEVFTDIGNQWYSSAGEQWELIYFCLKAIFDVIRQTRVHRNFSRPASGVGRPKEIPVLQHLVSNARMGRALTEMLSRVAASVFDMGRQERGLSPELAGKVLLLTLQISEYGLRACEDEKRAGKPLPTFATLLSETDSAFNSKHGDKFTIPSLLFHICAFGTDDVAKIQAAKTFALLCSVAQPGSLLRHVGYRATSTGKRLLHDIDPMTSNSATTKLYLYMNDPEVRQAYVHGLLHPDVNNTQMPTIFQSRPELSEVWEDASRSTCHLLSLLRMMTSMVTHQPQLFVQSFFDKALPMANPLGTLLKHYVLTKEQEWENDPRPAVKEAVLALVTAALECREPCRSLVLARTVPTLSINIAAAAEGIGNKLAGKGNRSCSWDCMPMIHEEDLEGLKKSLDASVGEGGLPCLLFDRSRSWPQCGFVRRSSSLVEAPMSLVVGPLTAHPAVSHRDSILKHASAVARGAFERAGFKDVNVTASWALEKPVDDPEFWPILAEALSVARFQLGQWMADGSSSKPEQAGEMSWWILIAGHVLRSVSIASSLEMLYPPSKFRDPSTEGYDTAVLVRAVRGCLSRVLGQWGDSDPSSPTAGILGMMIPEKADTEDGVAALDGLLGQAAGLFYGTVKVQVPLHRFSDTPRKRLSSTRLSPSPRKVSIMGDGSPKLVSPLVRPMGFSNNTPSELPSTLFPATPMMLDAGGNGPSMEVLYLDEAQSQRITLYELLRKTEAAAQAAIRDSGAVEELVPDVERTLNPSQLALAMLRGRVGNFSNASDGVAPTASKQMPGAFVCMDILKAVYPNCPLLLRTCQELNDVVGLAAAAFHMLTSVSQLIRVLLSSSCPYRKPAGKRMLLPTRALLNPEDWRGKGNHHSLVFVLLHKCLLHPPREGGVAGEPDCDPSPLVTLLDLHIRAEGSKLLTDMVAEVTNRTELVREGRLEKEKGHQDKYMVHRHLVWQIYDILQSMHATKDDNTLGIGQYYSRVGNARAGEADLLVALCLLGGSEDKHRFFKTEQGGDTAALAGALFPHLHQYLSMSELSTASQPDLECYRAAFVALCTFGVPRGLERHAVRLSATFLDHLRGLHRALQQELHAAAASSRQPGADPTAGAPAGAQVQQIVDRALLILKGLRSMAASPAGAAVFADAGVLPCLTTLRLFMPPPPDASGAAAAAAAATSSSSASARGPAGAWPRAAAAATAAAAAAPCQVLWQAILDAVTAAATPPPLDGRSAEVPALFAQHISGFVEHLGPRLMYLLGEQGLLLEWGASSKETARILQLIACVMRTRMAAGGVASAKQPAFSWLLPLLQRAVPLLKERLAADTRAQRQKRRSQQALHTAGTGGGGAGGLFDGVRGSPRMHNSTHHTVADAADATQAPLTDAELRGLYYHCEVVQQLCSVMRLHLVSFLPVAVPVGCGTAASPAVARLLEVLSLALETDGHSFTDRVNELCTRAMSAPEPVAALLRKRGHPFTSLDHSTLRSLREDILWECAACWAPSAAVTTTELYTVNQNAVQMRSEFEDMAVFGMSDDLSAPAKGLIELFDVIAERLAEVLETDPATLPATHKKGCGTTVAAVTSAAEQIVLLRNVYLGCLELAAPTEAQALWAENVLQRLLNEKNSVFLTPGTLISKRLYTPIMQLTQSGNMEEVARAKAALAFHCLDELRRQPEATPWLVRPCVRLHAATKIATARDDPQSKKMVALVTDTITLCRRLAKERHGQDIPLEK